MPAKKPKKKTTPRKKTADLMQDHVLRSAIVASLALFTLVLLVPLSPCKFIQGKPGATGSTWGLCGQAGWDSLAPGHKLIDQSAFWFGGVDLTGPARGFIFAGLFGVLYMLYLKVYNCCLTKCKCTCC